jgi:methyltransferase (TIGR00027 family)
VFEVDHHATQAWKRERLFRLEERLPANLTLVPVDFETDLLARSLAAAGFRSDRPALFSWIGTTYYLTADAITRTIDALSQLAAPGSELLLDYLLPESGMGADDRRILRRVRRFAERSGEPLLASFRPDEMEHALEAHGWHVLEDLSPQQQRETYLAGRNDTLLLPNLNHLLRARAGPDHG